MSQEQSEVAILLADITGSTPLYEAVGDAAAVTQISAAIDRLRSIIARHDGTFILSKGDDVLSAFAEPASALRAARDMLAEPLSGQLAIHAGMHYGNVVHTLGDIFGDAVNLTARLAALARPGEVLVSRSFVDRLPAADAPGLRILDNITFKGKSAPTEVYSLLQGDAAVHTEMAFGPGAAQTRAQHQETAPEVTVTLRYGGRPQIGKERQSLSIGRSTDCDVVIGRSWVSRQHALVTVKRGKVQLEDRSSSGTYVSMRGGYEFFMRRETVVLAGIGVISPAVRPSDANAEVIHYEVVGGTGAE